MKMVGTYEFEAQQDEDANGCRRSRPDIVHDEQFVWPETQRRTFMKALLLGAGSFCYTVAQCACPGGAEGFAHRNDIVRHPLHLRAGDRRCRRHSLHWIFAL